MVLAKEVEKVIPTNQVLKDQLVCEAFEELLQRKENKAKWETAKIIRNKGRL